MKKDINFKIIPVVRKASLNEVNEELEDVQYWLSRPVKERIAAITFLISQSLAKGERMDKKAVFKGRLDLK